MPQVTVYVREEDLDKWKAIQRKSEFVSNAINGLSSNVESGANTEGFEPSNLGSSPSEPAIDTKWRDASEATRAMLTPGCCLNKKNRCKHWDWDGLSSKYINRNTKDEIEVI